MRIEDAEVLGREGHPCPGDYKVDTPSQKWREDYESGRGIESV